MDKELLSLIVNGLQEAIGCPVIKSNQTKGNIPPYPYVSFTIVTPVVAHGGGWGYTKEGKYKSFEQVWSFTIQSDNDSEAFSYAVKAFEWFDRINPYFEENKINVVGLSNMTNRDNIITIQYEYRYGFDVTFSITRVGTSVVREPYTAEIELKKGKR